MRTDEPDQVQPDDYRKDEWGVNKYTLPSARVRDRHGQRNRPKEESPTTGTHYRGSKRLPDTPDGLQVWRAHVCGQWKTFYEVPLLVEQYPQFRRHRSTRFPAKSRSLVRPKPLHERVFAEP